MTINAEVEDMPPSISSLLADLERNNADAVVFVRPHLFCNRPDPTRRDLLLEARSLDMSEALCAGSYGLTLERLITYPHGGNTVARLTFKLPTPDVQ